MISDQHERDAADKRREARQLGPRVLLFALIVLMSHVLEVRPSTVDAAGVKIAVADAVVIRGGLALIFYFYFWSMVTSWMDGAFFFPLATHKVFMRNLIKSYRGALRAEKGSRLVEQTPKEVKRYVRSLLNTRTFLTAPFVIVCMLVVGVALGVGIKDVWDFGAYVIVKLGNPEGLS
ncbi:hypothetical protein [Sphingopyxis sp. MSC1_008]|jgi:hypothetical protein|uniref:hypothetical protein n=1 Tax=Sphingopyxis sp. MSC1_008 TaxID=2909265 RepID=UPI0020BFD98B|nr:hypothetical protein [Sphingopyxis sp. MSC1_008]